MDENNYPAATIIELIETQAAISPYSNAVSYKNEILSYQELNKTANQLANHLILLGIQPGTLVGIYLKQSIETITCILALLKIGAAYVPLDPSYPSERIKYMLANANISTILSTQSLLKHLPDCAVKTVCLDTDREKFASYDSQNINTNTPTPQSLAYVLYTSGSTGKPKGVMITHANLLNAYFGWKKIYSLNEKDNHLQMASFSFDVFGGNLIRALCSGGKLVLCPQEILLEPIKLYELLKSEKINCAEFVPTVLRRLIEHLDTTNKNLHFMRLLICGSDNWSLGEYKKFKNFCSPQTRVINSYGLTEATIDSTYFETDFPEEFILTDEYAVPIGKPFPNTNIYLLNANMEQVPPGELGEIYITGPGLAAGYFNNLELSKEKFITLSINEKNIRAYKTGDLGCLLPDDNIQFLGRIDNQVKVRGFRIEITEIENTLNQHPAIKESLVTIQHSECDEQKDLIAWLVLRERFNPSIKELREFISNHLPHFMMPNNFLKVEALPLTPNGKLDRQISVPLEKLHLGSEFIAPRNILEDELVKLFSQTLNITDASIQENFCNLGINSLQLVKLTDQVNKQFSIELPLQEIAHASTIEKVAQLINIHVTQLKN